jgi:hypothetical protein
MLLQLRNAAGSYLIYTKFLGERVKNGRPHRPFSPHLDDMNNFHVCNCLRYTCAIDSSRASAPGSGMRAAQEVTNPSACLSVARDISNFNALYFGADEIRPLGNSDGGTGTWGIRFQR